MDIPHEQWHDVTIEIGGEEGTTVTVKHLRNGADETESFEAETTIPGGGRIGFGVGSEADFRFDDVGTREDVTLTASTSLRYHYDANGRVVGRTLDPDGTPESQFFIYDGDRIIQELDGSGNLVAAWDYGVYIDEILVMYRDVVPPAGLEPYYYLQDDHYNVIGLADATGTVVERYAYDDYGAPTIYNGDGTATRTTSAYFNPFLFQGRRWDEVLSLYDFRTRYYDPALGRFLRIATIGLWGDANNLGNPYAFVGNNPWSRLDPYGEQPAGFLGFDADGKGIQQPTLGETWEAAAEMHRELVQRPVRWLDPNPNGFTAALENELLGVDRNALGDIDLIEKGNGSYTTTQIVLVVSPTKIFKVIKGVKNAVAGARGARTVTISVNSAEEGAEALGKIAAASDKVEIIESGTDAARSVDEGIEYGLRRPTGVSDEAWQKKLDSLNRNAEQGRAKVVHHPPARGNEQRQARESGLIKEGHDADHELDLQFGGEPSIENIGSTDKRVNRSVGGQGQRRLEHLSLP